MSEQLWLGVDGGDKKTIALVGNHKGQIIGRGQAGGSYFQVLGVPAAQNALKSAIDQAVRSAIYSHDQLHMQGICLGISGLESDIDQKIFKSWAADL